MFLFMNTLFAGLLLVNPGGGGADEAAFSVVVLVGGVLLVVVLEVLVVMDMAVLRVVMVMLADIRLWLSCSWCLL